MNQFHLFSKLLEIYDTDTRLAENHIQFMPELVNMAQQFKLENKYIKSKLKQQINLDKFSQTSTGDSQNFHISTSMKRNVNEINANNVSFELKSYSKCNNNLINGVFIYIERKDNV